MEKYPKELKYTRTHEWARVEGNEAVVGITIHAVEALGDIVFLGLPEVGKKVQQNKPFGEVESVKAVFELNSPVSGEVVAVNGELKENPQTVSASPYQDGWMIRVKISDAGELKNLLNAPEYEKLAGSEESH